MKKLIERFLDFITEVLNLEENVDNLGSDNDRREGGNF